METAVQQGLVEEGRLVSSVIPSDARHDDASRAGSSSTAESSSNKRTLASASARPAASASRPDTSSTQDVDVPASSLTEEAVIAAIDQVVDFALEPEASKENYVHGVLAKAILRQQLFGDMYTTPLLKKLQPCSLLSAQAGEPPLLPGPCHLLLGSLTVRCAAAPCVP